MTTSFPSGDPVGLSPEAATTDNGLDGVSESAGRPARAWGYRDLLYFLLAAVGAMVLLVPVCIAAFIGLSSIQDRSLDLASPSTQTSLVVVVSLCWSTLVLGYIYVIVTRKYNLPFASSIAWVPPSRSPALYLAGGVILAFTLAGAGSFFPAPEEQFPIELLLQNKISLLLMAVFGVLVAPTVEEIVFRGFFFPVFERKHGAVIAILATSVPFTLLHGPGFGWQWQPLALVLGVAVVLGIVRVRTGSIVATTLIHAAYNATLFSLLLATHDQIKEL